jgi:hypothetical protein
MPTKPLSQETIDETLEAFNRNGGNISATARELKVARQTIQCRLRDVSDTKKKPLAGGRLQPQKVEKRKHPKKKNAVHRFIVTSAQNNTYVNEAAWKNLQAFAKHYDAEILVGTYSYNQNAYGKLAVKRGTKKAYETELWFDPVLMPYIEAGDNRNIEVGPHLMWCGRANVIPTALQPLQGFESYTGRHSGIFPHARQMMVCVPALKSEATKFNYSTGTVTQQNYIQKKAGLKAEQHHTYGGLIVEVCADGRWYVRQLVSDDEGCMYDLDIKSDNGKITKGNRVAGINWGDIHCATIQQHIYNLAFAKGGMLDTLRPEKQFFHDTLDWKARDLHAMWKNLPRDRFLNYVEGFDSVEQELRGVATFLQNTEREWCESVVVFSNHDSFFLRWLDYCDHKKDPINARYYLHASTHLYDYMWANKKEPNMLKWACERAWGSKRAAVRFLDEDESFVICKKYRGGIECGMHGHDGANGARGNHRQFGRMARRTNTGHEHTAFLDQWGSCVAGIFGNPDQGYNHGPGSWSNTQIVTYANGARAAYTFWKGGFKA